MIILIERICTDLKNKFKFFILNENTKYFYTKKIGVLQKNCLAIREERNSILFKTNLSFNDKVNSWKSAKAYQSKADMINKNVYLSPNKGDIFNL